MSWDNSNNPGHFRPHSNSKSFDSEDEINKALSESSSSNTRVNSQCKKVNPNNVATRDPITPSPCNPRSSPSVVAMPMKPFGDKRDKEQEDEYEYEYDPPNIRRKRAKHHDRTKNKKDFITKKTPNDNGDVTFIGTKKPSSSVLDMNNSNGNRKEVTNVLDDPSCQQGYLRSDRKYSPPAVLEPTPPVLSGKQICEGCGNRGIRCHNKLYSLYCSKAVHEYMNNNANGDWCIGFDTDRMERVYYNAYNEARRVDLHQRFGYYSAEWHDVPGCMVRQSLSTAVNMCFKQEFGENLEKHNDKGKKNYWEARRNNCS